MKQTRGSERGRDSSRACSMRGPGRNDVLFPGRNPPLVARMVGASEAMARDIAWRGLLHSPWWQRQPNRASWRPPKNCRGRCLPSHALGWQATRCGPQPEEVGVADVKVYGAPWCPDCRRSKKFLAEHRVPYDWVDIDQDQGALAYVQELQHGGRTIPTIVFPDGSFLLEPTDEALAAKLGLSLRAERNAYDLVIAGGGPAGLTAAIYAAREGIQAVVVDRSGLG